MSAAIIKCTPQAGIDAFLWVMWLMYCRAPRKASPELDGSYWLGEIGETQEKTWERWCPYSPAEVVAEPSEPGRVLTLR